MLNFTEHTLKYATWIYVQVYLQETTYLCPHNRYIVYNNTKNKNKLHSL